MRICKTFVPLLGFLVSSTVAQAIIVSGTDPNDPIWQSSVTAVGFSTIPGPGSCSGSLLNTGMHFLTAAHCILGYTGNGTVTFQALDGSMLTYNTVSMVSHPDFNPGNYFAGHDIGVITLSEVVDSRIGRLDLYTGSGELNQIGTVIGWGRPGTGLTGGAANGFGQMRREGQNTVDAIIGNNNILLYDFDNPNSTANSSLGSNQALPREVLIFRGDSGGPTLINGQIAGVHSFITCINGGAPACSTPPDLDGALNGTYGERFGDTRVSLYATWIQQQTQMPLSDSFTPVPEPSTYMAGLAAAAAIWWRRRKRG